MAQHPEKLKWRDIYPYGLSASQFGMALGFCGRISDYVHYLRHIVGTETEFKGNEFTAHGINTEPKLRALYELLTGCQVHDGGFFVTEDRILGCSPDGQIYFSPEEKPMEQQGPLSTMAVTKMEPYSSAMLNSNEGSSLEGLSRQGSGCSVRVPFKSTRRPRSTVSTTAVQVASSTSLTEPLQGRSVCEEARSSSMAMRVSSMRIESPMSPGSMAPRAATPSTPATPGASLSPQHSVRLLEIKSPYRALYDNTKPGYAPFGIPLHYMCQIQGQLAIADCEECDFFVYVDHPRCQVEAWRVRRSREFWQWAEPSLRQVSQWVREGPPDWLNRSFAFPPFSFDRIEVIPLVFPYDITAAAALSDARRFSFFAKFPSPYDALARHRDARGRSCERCSSSTSSTDLSQLQHRVQQWCHDVCGRSWADLTEYERIAMTVQAPVVRHLFDTNVPPEEEQGLDNDANGGNGCRRFCQTLSTWRRTLEANGGYENSTTAALWKSLLRTASAGRDPLVECTVDVPEDCEDGRSRVRCTLPSFNAHAVPEKDKEGRDEAFSDATLLAFYQRHFLVSLLPAPTKSLTGSPPAEAGGVASQCGYATPFDGVPIFMSSPTTSLRATQLTPITGKSQ